LNETPKPRPDTTTHCYEKRTRQLIKNALLLGMLLAVGGCASYSCNDEPGSACRAERLLYQNDLLQAKILISQANEVPAWISGAKPSFTERSC
jgi:hypothetical protein